MSSRREDARAFDEAWAGRAPADDETAALIRTAELVVGAAEGPSPAFRSALRDRLMVQAADVLVATPSAPAAGVSSGGRRHRARRRLAGATAAVATSCGAVALVTSSASALPGELLYPVKQGVENVQLAVKDDGPERGSYQLQRAVERLREAEAVSTDERRRDHLSTLLDDFTRQAEDGSSTLFGAYTTDADPASIDEVNHFAARATALLTSIATQEDFASPIRRSWTSAAQAVDEAVRESARLCASCEGADVEELVRSVSAAAQAEPRQVAPDPSSDASRPEPAGATPTSPAPPRPSAAPPTRSASPAPDRTPRVRDVTEPVVGALLGDEEQTGLVPELVGGLLGRPPR